MNKVIINADDFGRSPEINEAIVQSFKRGYVTQTTLMVNYPYANDAVRLAKENGFFEKVGLHLDLDDLSGKFSGVENSSIIQLVRNHKLSRDEKDIVRKEITEQISKYLSYGFTMMHIDGHHHIHAEPQILKILIPLAKDAGFKTMRISRNLMGKDFYSILKLMYKCLMLINVNIRKNFGTTCWMGSFSDLKFYKGKGDVELMVHPVMFKGDIYDVIGDDKYIRMDTYIETIQFYNY